MENIKSRLKKRYIIMLIFIIFFFSYWNDRQIIYKCDKSLPKKIPKQIRVKKFPSNDWFDSVSSVSELFSKYKTYHNWVKKK